MMFLSKLFRRPKPAPKTGTAIIEDAVARTLRNGKRGFVIAVLSEPESRNAEMVIAMNGDLQEGLYRVLQKLLSKPETKQEATGAMMMALAGTGATRIVNVVDADENCDCPIWTLRRDVEERSETVATKH
jgi:hypothetical protein